MRASDKKIILNRYTDLFGRYGYDHRALGWNDTRSALRYAILLGHWDLSGKSLLDFGCGFGDLFGYARASGLDLRYHGVDVNARLVEKGREIYPDAHLFTRDALRDGLPRKYDYVVSSGAHNLKLRDNRRFIRDTFRLFDRHAKAGFALNFLSNKVDYRLDHTYHADPAEILNLAYTYSRRVVLRNDYMPFEFTVFVDKRQRVDARGNAFAGFRGVTRT